MSSIPNSPLSVFRYQKFWFLLIAVIDIMITIFHGLFYLGRRNKLFKVKRPTSDFQKILDNLTLCIPTFCLMGFIVVSHTTHRYSTNG